MHLVAALAYVNRNWPVTEQDGRVAAFEAACGVGVTVSQEDLSEAVQAVLCAQREKLLCERYDVNMGQLIKAVRGHHDRLRWADGKLLKATLDAALLALLGPESTEQTDKKKKKQEKEGLQETLEKGEAGNVSGDAKSPKGGLGRVFEGDVLRFHKPGENPQPNEAVRQAHLAATGGKVVTRFPPEPNGFLHIGHAKAINFNFSYAAAHGGITYLRYDDTNPEAEEEKYFDSIAESVAWLGYQPVAVTHSSDYFEELYAFAVQLIAQGDAYVCHQTAEEMEIARGGKDHTGPRTASPWRDRPRSESVRLFAEMRAGKWEEGRATLRLRQDMSSANPREWDLVAYRVLKSTPHVHSLVHLSIL
jgi:glutaminyl-tRNA synthetase